MIVAIERPDAATEPGTYAKAILNILEDSDAERGQLEAAQSAALNILQDLSDDRRLIGNVQKAVLNVLDDLTTDKTRLVSTERAVVNILEDSNSERELLAATQGAVLNILEDFEAEKRNVERTNLELTREIAERKQAEEALTQAKTATEAANRDLESFSYSVAHDLRAPLRSIDGFSQALLEDFADKLDPEGRTYLGHVRQSAQRMAQLIDDLLLLSQVTRSELRRERTDLAPIARAVLARLQETEPAREVKVIIPAEVIASGDQRLLRVALENLLGNAWKFTSKRVGARIEFGQTSEAGEPAYFVRDNGVGFEMAYTHKLFGVFQRLHSASEFEGTGIGLATVHRIVRRHGGRIWAEGQVGRGATFFFTLRPADQDA